MARQSGGDRPAPGASRDPERGGAQVLYGRNAVREALRGPRAVRRIWASERAASEPWLASGPPVTVVRDPRELEQRCGSADHQGVCAEVAPYRYADADALLAAPDALVVALDEIQDPQNLGAICRTAECAGATGVVLPERRSAEVTPAVCKASAGAVEHLAISRVRNLADFLLEAREAGAWSYGADGGAPRAYTAPDYRGRVVLVMGSEGKGLRPRVAGSCDELVALPLHGRIGSLNVNAAAAALLYEVVRQRGAA
jgi:23S rRNA (guanosine2251-2'-O)-methyltransferase